MVAYTFHIRLASSTKPLHNISAGDEYKVMGLAPYGRSSFLDTMRKIVRLVPDGGFELNLEFFRHHREDIPYQWMNGSPEFGDLFSPALEHLLGPRRAPHDRLEDRHNDIARSAQAMYEEAFFHLLGNLQRRSGLTDLALAGGCAMNSVANGKVRRNTPFRRVYVQSAAGDAGGAIGSAFAVWHKLGGKRNFVMDHAYWGPAFNSTRYEQSWTHTDSTLPPPIAQLKILVMRPHYADASPRRSPRGRWSVGFRDAWSRDRVRSATARSSVTPAAPT